MNDAKMSRERDEKTLRSLERIFKDCEVPFTGIDGEEVCKYTHSPRAIIKIIKLFREEIEQVLKQEPRVEVKNEDVREAIEEIKWGYDNMWDGQPGSSARHHYIDVGKKAIETIKTALSSAEQGGKKRFKVGDVVQYHKEHSYEVEEDYIESICVYTDKDSTHAVYYMKSGYDCHEADIVTKN